MQKIALILWVNMFVCFYWELVEFSSFLSQIKSTVLAISKEKFPWLALDGTCGRQWV